MASTAGCTDPSCRAGPRHPCHHDGCLVTCDLWLNFDGLPFDNRWVPIVSDAVPQDDRRDGLLVALWREHGQKAMRYCGVSAFNVVFGLSLLVFFHSMLGWPGGWANLAGVTISAIPAYYLSKRWVWQMDGRVEFATEVLPFWTLGLIGLALSTFTVSYADHRWDSTVAVMSANLVVFGVVWVAKYFVLDQVLWKAEPAEVPAG